MSEIERRQHVTPLELFFDLVFVFAFTQVTTLLTNDPTPGGVLRGGLVLAALWWTWAGFAWLTNALDPDEGGVRLAIFGAMAATLVAALAVPDAFGQDGAIFGVAYFLVRATLLALNGVAARGNQAAMATFARIVPAGILAPALLVVAGFVDGTGQLGLWALALAIDYLGVLMADVSHWRMSPEHFVERHRLVIIIALGESIFAIGIGVADTTLDAGTITASVLAITGAAALWWSYFDYVTYMMHALLMDAADNVRSVLARDVYTYLHLPMVAGIVSFAFGLKATLHDPDAVLETVPGVSLYGGIALYLLGHVALRLRISRQLGHGRPVAALLLAALMPVALNVPALIALAILVAVSVSLIIYETLRHPQARAFIRSHRGVLTMEEARAIHLEEQRSRPHRRSER